MNFKNTAHGPEERLDALLAGRPIVPSADFVSRTLARVLAESNLVSLARAGDEQAIDALLDNWLADQPVAASTEAAQAAVRTRRVATQKLPVTTQAPWRHRLVKFPIWAQSMSALSAAAAVAFMAFFYEGSPVAQNAGSGPMMASNSVHVRAPVATEDTQDYLASTSDATTDDDVASLNSLSDAAALLDKDNVALLMTATQADESSIN
jgi:hypothetical protein